MRVLASARIAHHQFVPTDHPAVVDAAHSGLIGGPEGEAAVVLREDVKRLDITAGSSFITLDIGEHRPEHMLGGAVFLQCPPDIIDPFVYASIGLSAEADNLHVVRKTGAVALEITLVDRGGVLKHHILECNAVADVFEGHS